MESLGLNVSELLTCFYYENFTTIMKVPAQDGVRTLTLPLGGKYLPMVSVEDIGKAACHCMEKKIKGKYFIASAVLTGSEIAQAMTEGFGEQVNFYEPSHDEYRGYGFPGADELGNMFEYQTVHNDMWI